MEVFDRIRLIEMGPDPDPVPPGTTGTIIDIVEIDGKKHLTMEWDINRSLNVVIPPDKIEVIGATDEAGRQSRTEEGNQ